jgi:hypothetical protein
MNSAQFTNRILALVKIVMPVGVAIVVICLASDRMLDRLVTAPEQPSGAAVTDLIHFSRDTVPFEAAARLNVLPKTHTQTGGIK